MPAHPLAGQSLRLVRSCRGRSGKSFVFVEDPQGYVLRLPVEWTDRVGPWQPLEVDGRNPKLDARVLLALAGAVDAVGALREADSGMLHVSGAPDVAGSVQSSRGPAPRAGEPSVSDQPEGKSGTGRAARRRGESGQDAPGGVGPGDATRGGRQ